MAKVTPISEHFQHFLGEMKESFWGDLNGQTKLAWQRFFELQSKRQRDRFSGWGRDNGERARGAITATATTSGIWGPASPRLDCALPPLGERAFCPADRGR